MELPYVIESTNVDGEKMLARFLSAKSAYMFASRLQSEKTPWVAKKYLSTGDAESVSLGQLKKEASLCGSKRSSR